MEVTRLNESFKIIHGTAAEFSGDPELVRGLENLYSLVFQKDKSYVQEMLKWHSGFPFRTDYFLGQSDGHPVSFNYYLTAPNVNNYLYSLSGGSLSHPHHRGSFISLFPFACSEMLKNSQLLFGFCNERSFPVFVHPINKWKEIKSFQQLKLMANAIPIKTHTEFEVISIQQIWATESSSSLNRSPVFLNWRLSRDLGYKVIRNMKTGAITVYKHFEGELDLLCILNCQNPDQYQSELKELLNHFCNSDSHFGGLNIFHTFDKNSFIESAFISIPLVHRRFLCGRTEGGFNFDDFVVEMIDSDTF